jgi:hypothetical protein
MPKRLELLREVIPGATVIAYLIDKRAFITLFAGAAAA